MALTQLRTEAATGRITPLAILDASQQAAPASRRRNGSTSSEPEAAVAKTDMVAHHLMAVKENPDRFGQLWGYWTEHKATIPSCSMNYSVSGVSKRRNCAVPDWMRRLNYAKGLPRVLQDWDLQTLERHWRKSPPLASFTGCSILQAWWSGNRGG